MNAGLANNIAQGQAQRDVGVDDRAEQQRPTTEIDRRGGPVPKVSGRPEATAPLAIGGLPLQARHQRRLQPPSGTLSPPTAVISDSVFEEWFQSDDMKIPMFSLSKGPQQLALTVVALTAAAPSIEAVTGTRVFPAASSKSVAEAPASSADAASAAVPAAAPATGCTVFATASVEGAARVPASADETAALTTSPVTGSTVPSATSVGGAPASPAVAPASEEILAAEPVTSGTVPSATSVGGTPASSAVAAASEEIMAAEPATSDTVSSPESIRGAVRGRESSMGEVSSDAEAEATPSTGGTAAPATSTAREARALASAAGSAGKICGERGASTHPFDSGTLCPLEVHYYSGSWLPHDSSSGSSSSSNNDNTNDHDSWWDATCVGALLRPFDPGKRCRWSTRRGKVVLGVDLLFERGKEWERMQHGG